MKLRVAVVAETRARPGGSALRLIAPDLVGLGLSSKPHRSDHSVEAHSRWLGALVDELVPGPAVVVAQDWGGPIALHTYSSRRSRLRGLVLGNTAVGPPRQGENAAIIAAGDALLILTNDGQLTVARASDKTWTAVTKLEVATSPTWAHPVFLGDRLLVKDEQTLALLRVGQV